MSMTENRISSYLYNKRFSESNEEKCTAFPSIAWSLIVHKNAIKNCSTVLQAFSFRSLSLHILYFLFHKGKNTSAIHQLSVKQLVHVFPMFFRFHKCFNSFHLRTINKFFQRNMCFFIVLPPWRKGVVGFSLK